MAVGLALGWGSGSVFEGSFAGAFEGSAVGLAEGSAVSLAAGLLLWAACWALAVGVAEDCTGAEDEATVDVGVAALVEDGVITVACPTPSWVEISLSFTTASGIYIYKIGVNYHSVWEGDILND